MTFQNRVLTAEENLPKFDIYIDIYILKNRHLHFGKWTFTWTFKVSSGWVNSDIYMGEFDINL